MRKQLEKYILSIINGERNDLSAKIISIFLSILEIIYLSAVKGRELFYKFGIFNSYDVDSQVISIGNITTGGTGKTPLVEKLASDLNVKGKKVVVLSRGYRSRGNGPKIISDGSEIFTDVDEAGDEVYMMAAHLADIPVIKGKNRYKAAKMAVDNFSPDIIILDDSFQHWKMERDLDIVVIDALNPFGYNHLIPRGLLREPPSALKRADMVIISRSDQVSKGKISKIKNTICKYNNDVNIYISNHRAIRVDTLASTSEEVVDSTDHLNNKKALALSGIGNPESFIKGLKELGIDVVESANYPDHYYYNDEDVMDIAMQAQLSEAEMVITTDKDAVKLDKNILNNFEKMDMDLYSLGIDIDFKDEIDISAKVISMLKEKSRQSSNAKDE